MENEEEKVVPEAEVATDEVAEDVAETVADEEVA